MRLSWNEIRTRAAAFAQEWAGKGYEKGQTQLFYQHFFEVFGMPVRRVATFEEPVKKLGDKQGYIDLFWKGVLLVEQKSAGGNRIKAKQQALDYFPGLKDAELPRYVLISDFQTFDLYDLDEDEQMTIALADLPRHVEKFGFILGVQKRTFKDQDPVNIKASELVGKLHDALEADGYTGHNLEQFLVRIVFCLFADDTGIFEPRDIFLDLLENRTREDGSDLGGWLAQLFQVLNTPEDSRQKNLDADLDRFPYINGDLFRDALVIPSFDAAMRQRLIDACLFDWSAISPAIFGSLFQSVMNPVERRAQGAHYTTEKNIMKVIGPLFLDDLRAEFARLKARRDSRRLPELLKFQEKLGGLRFLDPACGCGNFLIIAYRELRALEIELLRETKPGGQLDAWADVLSLINVDQFYGIEISEFPARIAETALWMMDHIMNNRLSLEFGRTYVRIPLNRSPHIRNADALEMDWAALLPPAECSFVLGNPPFVGQSMQSSIQRAQMANVIDTESGRAGSLDYVGAWFIKAGYYIQNGHARIGFVATNSITQGEQVAQLWPILFDRCHLELAFAHRTFAWGSDARGKAHVHVVILGLSKAADAPTDKRLFAYDGVTGEPHESVHGALTPYLFDGGALADPHLVVREAREPIDALPVMRMGSKLVEGGHYIFDEEEKERFLTETPAAAKFLVPLIGSQEFIQGNQRWILALQKASVVELKAMPAVTKRIQTVREYRAKSKKAATRNLADSPVEFEVTTIPTAPFLVIPRVSSERREYVPFGWMEPPTIPSDAVSVLLGASKSLFGLLTSAMHMSWLRHIGGRLKSDYRYSIGLVYNTFPMPPVDQAELEKLEPLAQAVLDARAAHQASPEGSAPAGPGATLADLYDPDLMPANLRRAHQALDRAVDRLYAPKGFTSDFERVAHLFGLYEKMTAPLALGAAKPKTRRRKKLQPSSLDDLRRDRARDG